MRYCYTSTRLGYMGLLVCLALAILTPSALAKTYTVTALGPGMTLQEAVARARSGDEIILKAGTYIAHDLMIRRSVRLRADVPGDVIVTAERPVAKGLIVTDAGVDLEVDGITFLGAVSPDRNGAGLRHQGRHLTVRNARFEVNENGILGSSAPDGVIKLIACTFVDNGYGNGYSHAIYINHVAQLQVTRSVFKGTRVGHHIKSLADETFVFESQFKDGYGAASYAVDVTHGGALHIRDSQFTKGAGASNAFFVNYATDRGGKAGEVLIEGSRFTNHRRSAQVLANRTRLAAVLRGNELVTGEGTRLTLGSGPMQVE